MRKKAWSRSLSASRGYDAVRFTLDDIKALFGAFALNEGHPGNGQAYIAQIVDHWI